jgi:hypothetical protein
MPGPSDNSFRSNSASVFEAGAAVHVPFALKSDKYGDITLSQLGANRVLTRRSKKAPLFDHLVRERKQIVGNFDAERLGRLEIDHGLEFGRLQHRKVGGFRAFENPRGVDPILPIRIGDAPSCCTGLVAGVPDYIVEYGTDTARTIASLILSGTSQKYPDINWIWSHGGGGLTAFAERFLVQVVSVPPYKDKLTRETVARELNRFHYDPAQITWHRPSSSPDTMARMRRLVRCRTEPE